MSPGKKEGSAEEVAVANFLEYLRIPSVHPNVNYDDCVAFLKKQAVSLGLPLKVYSIVPGKPIVVLTWEGSEPNLPSVLLNSHMDVVPVFPEKWTHEPFSADKDKDGNIYARGAQDMKCVGIQYLEAVRQLMSKGVQLRRTVHISFVPDEEIGGKDGMAKFINTSDFLELNVGFALDEGQADPSDEFQLFYGERSVCQMLVHCPGTTGHGSLLLPDTAGEKVRFIIENFMDFREQEKKKLDSDPSLTIGDVTSVNLTQLKGGVQSNVVPPEFVIGFDVRLAVTVDHVEFDDMVNKWCSEAGPGTYVEFEQKESKGEVTKLDSSNPWWLAFKSACDDMKLKLKPVICQAITDIRFLRKVGLPALGFSPMNKTPLLVHDHDEFLNEDVFLKGINIYCQIIPAIGNVAPPNK